MLGNTDLEKLVHLAKYEASKTLLGGSEPTGGIFVIAFGNDDIHRLDSRVDESAEPTDLLKVKWGEVGRKMGLGNVDVSGVFCLDSDLDNPNARRATIQVSAKHDRGNSIAFTKTSGELSGWHVTNITAKFDEFWAGYEAGLEEAGARHGSSFRKE